MTKQQFLDKEVSNDRDWVAQQLIIAMSKTKLESIDRAFRAVYDTAYKSWARDLPFHQIMEAVSIATGLSSGKEKEDIKLPYENMED